MSNTYNFQSIEATFKTYLVAENISSSTLTNYLSDYRHYVGWVTSYKKTALNSDQLNNFLNEINFHDYKQYQIAAGIPLKTINRRFSTIRKLCTLCVQQGWLKRNPSKDIHSTHKSLNDNLTDFELSLHKSQLHQSDQKEIVEDIKEFLLITSSTPV